MLIQKILPLGNENRTERTQNNLNIVSNYLLFLHQIVAKKVHLSIKFRIFLVPNMTYSN